MITHIGVNVTNLEASINFYTKLFGTEPIKVRVGYAKFLLEDPALNFTLNLNSSVSGNQVSHFGLQVKDTDEVVSNKKRIELLGLETREEMNVTCCYAVQDKFWVNDPDGNEWEFFFTKAEAPVPSNLYSSCCSA
jgi:catechol 2,3-dioxygenase-like lactoylglutathione lyase family enzyme